jgi:2-hydroxy-6-oxonona-2,4-dienedioate hydrolase
VPRHVTPKSLWSPVNNRPMFARAYTEAAAGAATVVLVHGLGVSGRYMVPTAQELAPDHHVYVPDLPGFGASVKPAHIHDIAELTTDLATWMQGQQLAHVCLVGNSLGCQIIVELALRYPELAASAILVGPAPDPAAPTMLAQMGRGAHDMLGEPLRYWPVLGWEYLKAGPIRTLVTLRHALREPIVEKLAQVTIPTLVIRGSRDPIAPQRWVEEMARRLPRGRLLVLPGVAHVPNYSAPVLLANAVRQFLQEAARAPG